MKKKHQSELVKTEFGKTLKRLRQERGLSQEEVAAAAKSHSSYISQLENGIKQPTLSKLFDIAEALKISPAQLVNYVYRSLEGELQYGFNEIDQE